MKVRVNGEFKEMDEGISVRGLLVALGIEPKGIAVDINREIVPKSRFEETLVRPDDVIEIVRMAGGG